MSSRGSTSRAPRGKPARKPPPIVPKTNLKPGQKPGRGAVWDQKAVDHFVNFCRMFLVLSQGEYKGKPFELAEWQIRYVIAPFFGWKRPDGTRWFRRIDLWIARKNGKSTLAAAVALYLTFFDGENAAEVYLVANDKNQAAIVFHEAKRMVEADPMLKESCEVYDSDRTKAVVVPQTLSSLQAISSEPTNKDGLNISACIFDEIHELKDRNLWQKMRGGSGARRQPVFFVISTAGYDRNTVGWDEYQTDLRIIKGKSKITDRLVVIFEANPSDDWKAEPTWRKANPMFDSSAEMRANLRSRFAEALEKPSEEAAFKRYHLNVWTGSKTGAIDMDKWDKCDSDVPDELVKSLPCWIGLDLSKRTDITAGVNLWKAPPIDSYLAYYVRPHFWVPEEDIELKESRDGVPYREWAAEGLVTLTPGAVVDYAYVEQWLMAQTSQFNVREVAYDPYNAQYLATRMLEKGVPMVEFPQHIKFTTHPTKELFVLVASGRIAHAGNPVLRWMASNAASVRDANDNEKLTKKGSTSRIDGLAAMVNALGRASLDEGQESVYASRGLLDLSKEEAP